MQLSVQLNGATSLPQLVKYKKILIFLTLFAFSFQTILHWVILQPLVLGALVVSFAYFLPPLGNFGKFGDFSYGVYVVHFPVLQVIVSFGMFEKEPWLALGFAGALVFMMAILFWHFIEKPFLRKSSHYVTASSKVG